ncbi:Protein CBG18035 [Caenorhabditis briggsae]|uniref:Protein CBG18035 n=1 Tax=Caenorhabditis briggsae TaxID=6238 RepID=A8XSV9_CAEBR|nr:Protein CBG18035 [Caenorhabditis briggsae]CAP35562.2 Protein CBG18035 [Caenorhabditis briggsae]
MSIPAVKMVLVYVTAPSKEVAMKLARLSPETKRKLQLLNHLYMWKGKVEEDQEHVVVMKTVSSNVEELSKRVRSLHPAETLCFITLPIEKATSDFADWIIDSTKKPQISQ